MHIYYYGFERLSEQDIEEALPECDVPETLNFQEIQDDDPEHEREEMAEDQFIDWLTEGKYDPNCEAATKLLTHWMRAWRATDSDTLQDFFRQIISEVFEYPLPADAPEHFQRSKNHLSLHDLIQFMAKHCFSEMDFPREQLEAQLQQRLTQEFAMVAAYVRTWRGTAAYSAGRTSSVHDRIATSTSQRVLPWPQIQETPTPRFEDGRFCKSFPLHFPMGTADFRQSRLRSDFTAADWCQHLLR